MFALNSLRIEKGYKTWKGDLSTDYTLLEGRLDKYIEFNKNIEFVGKQALLRERQNGVKKKFVILKVNANGFDAPYMSTLWYNNKIVGEITSGAWGYRVNHSIALGMLKNELCVPGTEIDIEIYGKKIKAEVQKNQPLWDPYNLRIKS